MRARGISAVAVVAAVGLVLAQSSTGAAGEADLAKRTVREVVDLSGRSRPVVVLTPDSDEGRRAGSALAAVLRRRGAQRLTITSNPAEAVPKTVNVVAVGNMLDNELICRLYWNQYCYADARWPGGDRVFVRTVFDPYPWHNGGDVVVVAASTTKALARTGEVLDQTLVAVGAGGADGVTLPFTVRAVPAFAFGKEAPPVRPTLYDFLTEARQYLKSGDEKAASRAVEALAKTAALYREDSKRLPDWPEETSSFDILATWDAFEEYPGMTAGQRREFLGMFLNWMEGLQRKTSGYAGLGKGDLVTWNHTTFPLLGLYAGARYFRDYAGGAKWEERLAKARACFLAQAKSWKPQEDADNYIPLTMRHTIQYCLSEWYLDPFEQGVFRRYWDYLVDICDSAGLASGFGDSGVSRGPTVLLGSLPIGFWSTRDAGYLWILNHVSGAGVWENPYWQDVTPRRPDRFVGLRVIPLDSQLHTFTQTKPFYNEALMRSPVPPERGVDKIVMRDGWSKDSQYVILDGYGRGKHLHYDTAAIIEYVDRGHRWLLDHDYLSRNTTEHNMLTVLRDGRATQLVPTMADLVGWVESASASAVSVQVPDDQGVDWQRSVFWRKGRWLLVADAVQARQAGQYDLDWTWKTEDEGRERLENDGSFVVLRGGVDPRTRDITAVADATASGGKAVLLGEATSRLAMVVAAKPGEYALELYARGADGSSDSLLVSVDGAEPQAYHVPQRGYDRSSTKFDLTEPTPKVAIGGDARHVVVVSLRENPPVYLDRLRLVPVAGGDAVEIEVENAPSATQADRTSLRGDRFTIVTPDAPSMRLSRGQPKGIAVPVCRLHQRISAALGPDQGRELASLLYCDQPKAPAGWEARRLGPGRLVVSDGPTFCVVGPVDSDGIILQGGLLMADPRELLVAETTEVRVGTIHLSSVMPFSLALDLKTGSVRARNSAPVTCELDRSSERIPPGAKDGSWMKTRLLGWRWGDDQADRWEALVTGFYRQGKRSTTRPTSASIAGPAPQWQMEVPGGPAVRRMRVADLDGDGAVELLVAANSKILAFDLEGRPRWESACRGAAHDVFPVELGGSKGMEVLVADGAGWAYALDAEGRKLHELEFIGLWWSASVGERKYGVLTVGAADLDNDGRNEIIVTGLNFEMRVYDEPWKLRWKDRKIYHGNIDLLARDVTGDGRRELFASDHYGHLHLFGADGKVLGRSYSSIGDVMFDVGRFRADGPWVFVFGSSTGDCTASETASSGEVAWRFDNFGYAVRRVLIGREGSPLAGRCLIASATGYVYCLDERGRLVWKHRLGCDVVDLVECGYGEWSLCALDRGGDLWLMTADGKALRRFVGPVASEEETWRHLICLPDRIIAAGTCHIVCHGSPRP
ncbi:MAG: hypothetical protein JXQ73_03270 [Phycisphaerae bacterium]|nr:hypothetical protein [Phycisphaerae bacterium]